MRKVSLSLKNCQNFNTVFSLHSGNLIYILSENLVYMLGIIVYIAWYIYNMP